MINDRQPQECTDPDCGCKEPVATTPIEMLRFLSERLKFAGVDAVVAKSYARDIDEILSRLEKERRYERSFWK